jgi:ribosomal protein L37E
MSLLKRLLGGFRGVRGTDGGRPAVHIDPQVRAELARAMEVVPWPAAARTTQELLRTAAFDERGTLSRLLVEHVRADAIQRNKKACELHTSLPVKVSHRRLKAIDPLEDPNWWEARLFGRKDESIASDRLGLPTDGPMSYHRFAITMFCRRCGLESQVGGDFHPAKPYCSRCDGPVWDPRWLGVSYCPIGWRQSLPTGCFVCRNSFDTPGPEGASGTGTCQPFIFPLADGRKVVTCTACAARLRAEADAARERANVEEASRIEAESHAEAVRSAHAADRLVVVRMLLVFAEQELLACVMADSADPLASVILRSVRERMAKVDAVSNPSILDGYLDVSLLRVSSTRTFMTRWS